MSIRTREGGFRGVASIVHLERSTADAPSRAAGEGVFHEFHTAAVWPFRLGSAPAVSQPEALESRQLLATGMGATYLSPWLPTDQFVTNPITHQRELYLATEAINPNNPNSPGLSNEGKVVTGTDREGDKWVITVHGPGKVIVTDTTPNDGVLDDDINTIQLVGTNPKSTYVTGNVIASNTIPANFNGSNPPPSNGTILFNQLIAISGVKSIELNGFDLSDQVTPAVTSNDRRLPLRRRRRALVRQHQSASRIRRSTPPRTRSSSANRTRRSRCSRRSISTTSTTWFQQHDAERAVDHAAHDAVGRVHDQRRGPQLRHRLGQSGAVPWRRVPVRVPAGRDDGPNVGAGDGDQQPQRARVRQELHGVAVAGAVLVGEQRAQLPAQGDVRRQCRRRRHRRQGQDRQAHLQARTRQPHGVYHGQAANGLLLPATIYGTPKASTGYPAAGFLGGQIRAKSIKKLNVGQANVQVQTAQNPNFVQLEEQGYPDLCHQHRLFASPTRSITTSGSIGQANVSGTSLNTEIKTGFDLTSFICRAWRGLATPSEIQAAQGEGRPDQYGRVGHLPPGEQSLRQANGDRRSGPDQQELHRQEV